MIKTFLEVQKNIFLAFVFCVQSARNSGSHSTFFSLYQKQFFLSHFSSLTKINTFIAESLKFTKKVHETRPKRTTKHKCGATSDIIYLIFIVIINIQTFFLFSFKFNDNQKTSNPQQECMKKEKLNGWKSQVRHHKTIFCCGFFFSFSFCYFVELVRRKKLNGMNLLLKTVSATIRKKNLSGFCVWIKMHFQSIKKTTFRSVVRLGFYRIGVLNRSELHHVPFLVHIIDNIDLWDMISNRR